MNIDINNLPLPKPLVDYDDERKKALRASKNRKTNYEKYQISKRDYSLDYLPLKLDIENVSRCNFHCSKCQVSGWSGNKRAEDLSLNNFKLLIDSINSLIEIKIQGMGEPLLGSDTFFDMISYARSKHIWVRTSTNASLLHVNNNYEKLIESDPCEIQISIDGADSETYNSIRKGGNFERVKENCKLINRFCEKKNLLKTRMWVCLEKRNISQISLFVELAKKLSFRRLTYAVDLHGWGQKQFFDKNDELSIKNNITEDDAFEIVEIGKKNDVEVTFWSNINRFEKNDISKLCPWPFERSFISSDMKIVPCCMIANPEIINFGKASSFVDIWNNYDYQKFRKDHLEGNIPDVCKKCYINGG